MSHIQHILFELYAYTVQSVVSKTYLRLKKCFVLSKYIVLLHLIKFVIMTRFSLIINYKTLYQECRAMFAIFGRFYKVRRNSFWLRQCYSTIEVNQVNHNKVNIRKAVFTDVGPERLQFFLHYLNEQNMHSLIFTFRFSLFVNSFENFIS